MKRYCITNYCIQCVDVSTGQKGCFFFDQQHWKSTGEFKAIGPIYPSLAAFYKGTSPDQRQELYIEREVLDNCRLKDV